MTQLFNIALEGTDATKRVNNCQINDAMNRLYNVATFTIDDSKRTVENMAVVIKYGSNTFNGFVYSVNKIGRNNILVECRTHSAKLTEPFSHWKRSWMKLQPLMISVLCIRV